ncbi:CaiB/BaiF CoA transferase family protein [Chloroflexota bacterium]
MNQQVRAERILQGVRVVELTRAGVGPFAGRILGELGATVIHVESRRKLDPLRTTLPYKDNKSGINRAAYFNKYNANKYGMALDLTKPKGPAIFKKLIEWADIFLESNQPRTMAKYNLDYEGVKGINPSIIMLSTSMLGQTGPFNQFKAYGYQASALAGFCEITTFPDREPVGPVGAYTDMLAPLLATNAIIAALVHRRRTGEGQFLDQSQLESAIWFLAPMIFDFTMNKQLTQPIGNRCEYASPHGCYQCRGKDRWCAIAIFSDEEWRTFCTLIDSPALSSDTRFATFASRKANEDELDKLIEAWTITQSAPKVARLLQSHGISAGIVATGKDMHSNPKLKRRRHFKWLSHSELGELPYDSLPFRFSETSCEVWKPAPCLGEDTAFVCMEILKISEDEFAELYQGGYFD